MAFIENAHLFHLLTLLIFRIKYRVLIGKPPNMITVSC